MKTFEVISQGNVDIIESGFIDTENKSVSVAEKKNELKVHEAILLELPKFKAIADGMVPSIENSSIVGKQAAEHRKFISAERIKSEKGIDALRKPIKEMSDELIASKNNVISKCKEIEALFQAKEDFDAEQKEQASMRLVKIRVSEISGFVNSQQLQLLTPAIREMSQVAFDSLLESKKSEFEAAEKAAKIASEKKEAEQKEIVRISGVKAERIGIINPLMTEFDNVNQYTDLGTMSEKTFSGLVEILTQKKDAENTKKKEAAAFKLEQAEKESARLSGIRKADEKIIEEIVKEQTEEAFDSALSIPGSGLTEDAGSIKLWIDNIAEMVNEPCDVEDARLLKMVAQIRNHILNSLETARSYVESV